MHSLNAKIRFELPVKSRGFEEKRKKKILGKFLILNIVAGHYTFGYSIGYSLGSTRKK